MKKLVCILLALLIMTPVLAACSSEETDVPSSSDLIPTEETYEPQLFNHLASSDELQSVLVKEKGTSARVDELASYGKATVGHLGVFAADDAMAAIRVAYPDFYASTEEMELYMFYGYYLDYAFDDGTPQSELGTDLCQAIKYVYRGAEKVEDASTQSNLEQIAKSLTQIPSGE